MCFVAALCSRQSLPKLHHSLLGICPYPLPNATKVNAMVVQYFLLSLLTIVQYPHYTRCLSAPLESLRSPPDKQIGDKAAEVVWGHALLFKKDDITT